MSLGRAVATGLQRGPAHVGILRQVAAYYRHGTLREAPCTATTSSVCRGTAARVYDRAPRAHGSPCATRWMGWKHAARPHRAMGCAAPVSVCARSINVLSWTKRHGDTPGQKQLNKEMSRPGMAYDRSRALKDPSGKEFDAFVLPSSEVVPCKLPTAGKTLAGEQCNPMEVLESLPRSPTLLLLTNKHLFPHRMLESWRLPFSAAFPEYQSLHVCLVEDFGDRMFGPVLEFFTRRSLVDKERHDRVIHCYGEASDVRSYFAMENRFFAYAYLLDGARRVRWRGVGMASETEMDELIEFAATLPQDVARGGDAKPDRSQRKAEQREGKGEDKQ